MPPKPDSRTPKKTLGERLGKATGWLPAVAVFLCLAMFAGAGVALLDINSVPKTGQKSNATGLSAQGFAGLRRLLEARGHEVLVNRMEDGPLIEHGDLEIITLDDDGATLTYAYPASSPDKRSSSSEAASSEEASAPATPPASTDTQSASASESSAASDGEDEDEEDDALIIPDIKRSSHILDHPLGKVVLIVAPKWNADADPKNRYWDRGPTLVQSDHITRSLAFLSPMTEVTAPKDDKQTAAKIAAATPGTRIVQNGDRLVTFDVIPYVLKRDTRAVIEAAKPSGDAQKDVVANALNRLTPRYEPVPHRWTLRPAVGEGDFNAPLAVGAINGMQSITGPNLKPVLMGPNGEAVLSRVIVTGGRTQPKTPIYLLSDPDLLNNQILSDPQRVAAALTLTDTISPKVSAPGRVIFNLTFNGVSFDHDLLHALSRPPFIGVPLCLLIAGLGLMWAAFSRFGPAREAPVEAPLGRGVKILADNAARLMAITLKEVKLGPAYADLVRDQVIKDKGYRPGVNPESPDDLAERIGKAQKTTDSFIDLKTRAAKVMTVHQLIDITLRLHAWKTEIQRAHT